MKLASHTCKVLKGFLKDNFWDLNTAAHIQFQEGLEDVFVSALKLKAQTCLDPLGFRFQWPRTDEAFDPVKVDGGADDFSKSTHRIRLVLFPALIRVNQSSHHGPTAEHDRAETSIGRAAVLSQSLED